MLSLHIHHIINSFIICFSRPDFDTPKKSVTIDESSVTPSRPKRTAAENAYTRIAHTLHQSPEESIVKNRPRRQST